ncbi:unnamed protein product [Eruca vesicaria subsp. sativa]|uniref:Uncharacterized protein n=1 Tax=Eruca vesicaria subsp. sativa TaxID=29727 RepID=A0ABC8IXC9_ERUVS|nr:unnamed protein product [Eruca vesicaria subsp. sativa]
MKSLVTIPTKKFRFHRFEQLMGLTNTNSEFPEIVGKVMGRLRAVLHSMLYLKNSQFSEVDRAEYQFIRTACQVQYVRLSCMVMFGLLSQPATSVLRWLLHQKGLCDPLYDYEDHFDSDHHTRENAINYRLHHCPHHHHQLCHGVKTHNHHRRTQDTRTTLSSWAVQIHYEEEDILKKKFDRYHSESHYYQQVDRVHKDYKHTQHRQGGKHGIVLPRDCTWIRLIDMWEEAYFVYDN